MKSSSRSKQARAISLRAAAEPAKACSVQRGVGMLALEVENDSLKAWARWALKAIARFEHYE